MVDQDCLSWQMKLTIGDELAVTMQVEAVNNVIGGSVPAEQAHDRVMCVRFLTLELFAAQGVPLLLDLQTAEDTIANLFKHQVSSKEHI